MTRKMEENVYDNLTGERLDAPMTKVIVWDGMAFEFDVSTESNDKLNEHMKDLLAMGDRVEGDDLNIIVQGAIGGAQWTGDHGFKSDLDVVTEETSKPKGHGKGRAKFSDDQVRSIRKEMGSAGGRSATQLAEVYQCSTGTIYAIANGTSYRDVK